MPETAIQPTVHEVETSKDHGRFEIEPLEAGYGTTLGNSLRRVLLSSLTGAAVTAVSIEGVAHEFSSIKYVKEDVGEILLNIKQLSLTCHNPEGARLTLDVQGGHRVTAADISPTADVEIANPDLYLCTLDGAHAKLRMDLTVELGKGYSPADRNKKEGQPIGVIPVDAIFTPVIKANFLVEKTRVGQDTDWEKLILEIWTNGTIPPVEAVSRAAAYYTRHLSLFATFGESITESAVGAVVGTDLKSRLAEVPVDELELSVRALNCLKANDITKLGELLAMRIEELLALRNFGAKSLDEIKQKLVARGFVQEDEVDELFLKGDR
ncbi:MAG TPA: DNA-directed RNA polymerase subunit alpha [Candidatus Acidoferrales bacterium]|nr:DNA-directed RNA polymerase subunit alpha [Candidatus Acidoferrales bacterium]